MKCVYCNEENVIKYGKQCNKKRYKCKKCNRTFNETNDGNKYDRSVYKVLRLLYNLLDKNFYGANNIHAALKMAEKNLGEEKKIKFNVNYINEEKDFEIKCLAPKLLISAFDNKLIFYQIPAFSPDINAFSDNVDRVRTIKIIENYGGDGIKTSNLNEN